MDNVFPVVRYGADRADRRPRAALHSRAAWADVADYVEVRRDVDASPPAVRIVVSAAATHGAPRHRDLPALAACREVAERIDREAHELGGDDAGIFGALGAGTGHCRGDARFRSPSAGSAVSAVSAVLTIGWRFRNIDPCR